MIPCWILPTPSWPADLKSYFLLPCLRVQELSNANCRNTKSEGIRVPMDSAQIVACFVCLFACLFVLVLVFYNYLWLTFSFKSHRSHPETSSSHFLTKALISQSGLASVTEGVASVSQSVSPFHLATYNTGLPLLSFKQDTLFPEEGETFSLCLAFQPTQMLARQNLLPMCLKLFIALLFITVCKVICSDLGRELLFPASSHTSDLFVREESTLMTSVSLTIPQNSTFWERLQRRLLELTAVMSPSKNDPKTHVSPLWPKLFPLRFPPAIHSLCLGISLVPVSPQLWVDLSLTHRFLLHPLLDGLRNPMIMRLGSSFWFLTPFLEYLWLLNPEQPGSPHSVSSSHLLERFLQGARVETAQPHRRLLELAWSSFNSALSWSFAITFDGARP